MSGIIRMYNFANSKRLVNLLHVSSVELKNRSVTLEMAHRRESLGGGWIMFWGGNSSKEVIKFNTVEEAEKEYLEITQSLVSHYDKEKK